ncbi:nucleoporin nup189 [Moniliophthora roreri MCA 2997]|uniref:Nucleoporin nup189 n=1 Tax=Moniliophthora roreri (strain MCA 2997) TaxID=1381753 RepID=V2X2N9_MONRO|nr:nucleoporin nup189 [Moniliophthora roreri MCA 2997]
MAKFSAYVSDSDDSDEQVQTPPRKAILAQPHEQDDVSESDEASLSGESEISSDMHEDELRMRGADGESEQEEEGDEEWDEEDEEDMGALRSSMNKDPTLIPRARNVGVDPQRMHVMQTSLFRLPEEAAALKALTQPQPMRKILRVPSQQLSRKHSRDSEGDSLRIESRERKSFAYDDIHPVHRPSRKYTRVAVASSSSIANDAEDGLIDAGLAFGRSFRVGWGPSGTLVHLGSLCNPWSSTFATTSNTSVISLTKVPLLSAPQDVDINSPAAQLSSKLLQHHLSHSPITLDDSGVPFATPSPSSLNFSSFVALFPPTEHSFAATLFRLGEALFDDMDIEFRGEPDVRNAIRLVTRKARVSRWLEDTVLPVISNPSPSATALTQIFTLLTANQISRACEVASDAGYIKLATLISQSGGDIEFKEDLQEQLRIWTEEKADALIDEGVRRIYTLLAGQVDGGVDILKGLDWKRTFGVFLWFSEPEDASIRDVFDAYNAMALESGHAGIARPVPWYIENPQRSGSERWRLPSPVSISLLTSTIGTGSQPPSPPTAPDAHFSLLHLHSNPSLSLSQSPLLRPHSFGPSPVDFALPWHLYIILSRVLRARDFGDRSVVRHAEDSESVEGHSPSADLLANSYALQLEQMGLIQEATFVLLHIEGSIGRQKAIKDLLSRSADKLDEWMTRGLVGSLKIPMKWVQEAKALRALSQSAFYDAHELYLQAGLTDAAHNIAVLELAPDIVIRRDLDMLKDIFERFTSTEGVDGWGLRGKLFLDYVTTLTRLPVLLDELSAEAGAVPDAVHMSEIERLAQAIPKMISILPDIFNRNAKVDGGRHAVALNEMISELVKVRDRAAGVLDAAGGGQLHQLAELQLNLMDDATKLQHLRTSASARFMKSISVHA